MGRALVTVAALVWLAVPAQAQAPSNDDLQARVRALEEQVRLLQSQLAALVAQRPASQPAELGSQSGPVPPARPVPVSGVVQAEQADSTPQVPSSQTGAPTGGKIFNPDIGMIGNFISATGQSQGGSANIAPTPFATLQESEASFQAIVDPYARADFFLAIGEEGIEVEEGYLTFTTLPGGLLMKVGKMRANVGRLNAFHNHTLPWIDRPLVMYNLLGGSPSDPDTGIKDAGVSLSRLIPAGKLFVEATGEVYRGDSGTVFKSNRRADFSTVGHVRTYMDFSDASNLEIGGSYARGHNELGSPFTTQLLATDILFRWRPPTRAIYRSLAARTELFWSRREEPATLQRAFGGYAAIDYGFRRRWFVGARYDWSDRATDATIRDLGSSVVLTFWPSEFTQIRSQYRWTRFGDGPRTAHELLLQALFTIGAHGAHPF